MAARHEDCRTEIDQYVEFGEKAMELQMLLQDVKDIAPLPKAYLRIQELLEDPTASLDDLTGIVTNDAGLSSRILRIANSAYVGLPDKVDSISRAVQILGLNQVHDLALANAAVGTLFKIQSRALDLYDFWRRSIYCAVVARVLARRAVLGNAERWFVCGLLHEIGNLLIAFKDPPLYSEMRDAAIRRGVTLASIQRAQLGFDYAMASAELLKRWNLPAAIHTPIALHTGAVAEVAKSLTREVSLLHLAAAISRASAWGSDACEPVPPFDPLAVNLFALDEQAIGEIMGEADQAVAEAMSLLLPDLKKDPRRSAA